MSASAAAGTDRLPAAGGRASRASWVFLVLAAGLAAWQACDLPSHAAETDFGVFYRLARDINSGGTGEVYAVSDPVRHWHRHIPPAGLLPFVPLAALPVETAAAVWSTLEVPILAPLFLWCNCVARAFAPEKPEGPAPEH